MARKVGENFQETIIYYFSFLAENQPRLSRRERWRTNPGSSSGSQGSELGNDFRFYDTLIQCLLFEQGYSKL